MNSHNSNPETHNSNTETHSKQLHAYIERHFFEDNGADSSTRTAHNTTSENKSSPKPCTKQFEEVVETSERDDKRRIIRNNVK